MFCVLLLSKCLKRCANRCHRISRVNTRNFGAQRWVKKIDSKKNGAFCNMHDVRALELSYTIKYIAILHLFRSVVVTSAFHFINISPIVTKYSLFILARDPVSLCYVEFFFWLFSCSFYFFGRCNVALQILFRT